MQMAPGGGAPMAMQPAGPEQTYAMAIHNMFSSEEFMKSTQEQRKHVIGNAIYSYIVALVGEEYAPKVTGMIIDLDPVDLNMSIRSMQGLREKVNYAMDLLKQYGMAQQQQQQ